MLYGVKKLANIQVEHPVDPVALDRHRQGIERIMLPSPRTEAIGETKEVRFIDLVEDSDHSLLHYLVLQMD